jgi:hypothetical protein
LVRAENGYAAQQIHCNYMFHWYILVWVTFLYLINLHYIESAAS